MADTGDRQADTAGAAVSRTGSVRDTMIDEASALIAREGVAATSIGDVLAAADAPRGSVYHHFPGGRAELMVEAVRRGGERLVGRIGDGVWESPQEVVDNVAGMWRRVLVDSDFGAGCPVAAAGLAREREPGAAAEAEEIFARWGDVLTARLRADGADDERARSVSALVIAGLEGGVLLCRTHRSLDPLDRVVGELRRVLDAIDPSDW